MLEDIITTKAMIYLRYLKIQKLRRLKAEKLYKKKIPISEEKNREGCLLGFGWFGVFWIKNFSLFLL